MLDYFNYKYLNSFALLKIVKTNVRLEKRISIVEQKIIAF